jgi:CHAT domain-containing protein
LLLLAVAFLLSCARRRAPESVYEHAEHAFLIGELKEGQEEAQRGYLEFGSNPKWAWKFSILQARSALWQGLYGPALEILESPSLPSPQPDTNIQRLTLVGVASVYLRDFSRGEKAIKDAGTLCADFSGEDCGDVLQALGFLASEQKQNTSAEKYYALSLAFAEKHNTPFLKSTSLLNLGDESLSLGRFDEAIDRSQAAYKVADSINAKAVGFVAKGNLGWAFYQLGDVERAFDFEVEAQTIATQTNDVTNQENQLTNIGYIYMDQHKVGPAAESFEKALKLAQGNKAQGQIYNAQRVLARLALQTGDLDKASDFAEQALDIARESHNHPDDLYPLVVEGEVAAARGDASKARDILEAIEHDPACPAFLKWEAQRSIARLDDPKQPEKADREYRAALTTFESARSTVQSEDFQLSFLTNAAHIYDDYVHFLVAQGKPEEALRWADYSRARTLSEGLLSKGATNASGAPTLNAREISRRAKGVLLFYWLGEKQSYLWAITPQKTTLFPLPPGADIEAMVQRYRTALKGPQDVLEFSEDGRALYRTLIAPAQSVLGKDAKVFIIPDGSLNSLNFETLIVADPKLADPKPHFWIDDAIVTNASSLRVLNASFAARNPNVHSREIKQPRRLLLIGDNVSPSKEFAELPQAGQQMANVAKHFAANQEQIFQRAQATPSAYLNSSPENFSHIHFVAHGTASRLSPLDSAIVLSKGASETDSFKLYARDIVPHHLRAELVTISSCNSAGERAYTGEGLVGLAWAFLRAGAHNVIAGLWEVSDAPTEQLMDRFYDELDKEAGPDVALRAAKLSLLHHSQYRNPFYWAPFQLYTGS